MAWDLELGTWDLRLNLPKIYPITDTRLTNLSHAAQVEKLISGGALMIQLREKYASPKEFYDDAKTAIEIARAHSVKIIINDRVDIALALKADGVHLGQDDLPPAKAREILGEKAIIGFSTHSIRQAIEAAQLPIDYVAIGPVFATATKENPEKTVGIEGVRRVREAIGDFPLVAIGGITAENFREVFRTGADSVAVIKSILFPPDKIVENLQSFQSFRRNS
ncbi:MAG TPA: thiamine phosphate synthase [Pyrinomonadaceae bacterium]|nr:thiamine phosphate synthase [Pyrinomonadaceae bacterium]